MGVVGAGGEAGGGAGWEQFLFGFALCKSIRSQNTFCFKNHLAFVFAFACQQSVYTQDASPLSMLLHECSHRLSNTINAAGTEKGKHGIHVEEIENRKRFPQSICFSILQEKNMQKKHHQQDNRKQDAKNKNQKRDRHNKSVTLKHDVFTMQPIGNVSSDFSRKFQNHFSRLLH